MKRDIISGLRVILLVLIGGLIGAAIERHEHASEPEAGAIQIDSTKTQIDTATAVAPEPSEARDKDTVYIKVYLSEKTPEISENVPEIADSVPEIADSVLYLPVVIEQKVYEDPDSTYRAVVSGPALSEEYGPRLDSIQVFSRNTVQYQTKVVYAEPSRWSFGVTAGMTMTGAGVSPGITLGATYTIWRPRKYKRQ